MNATFQKIFTKLSGFKFIASITTPRNFNENLLSLSDMISVLILIFGLILKNPGSDQLSGFCFVTFIIQFFTGLLRTLVCKKHLIQDQLRLLSLASSTRYSLSATTSRASFIKAISARSKVPSSIDSYLHIPLMTGLSSQSSPSGRLL